MKALLLLPSIVAVEIKNLPGLCEPLNFRHYSGYLNASATRRLHYWFTESEREPASDPVLVWMNGGPGCSSLYGLLSELGPFHLRQDGKTFYLNPHSWNKVANVLFLESPAGAGFSYSTDRNITNDDYEAAEENYAALKDFYGQFPEFRNNSLYLSGESYAGVYIPTLAARIIDGLREFPLNIKGLAIGNGLLSHKLRRNTLNNFLYNHGFVDEGKWRKIEAKCCNGCADSCDFEEAEKSSECEKMKTKLVLLKLKINDWVHLPYNVRVNPYDIYADCYQSSPLCYDFYPITTYLNQGKVRRALAIPDHLGTWSVCKPLPYAIKMEDQYQTIHKALNASLRILIYHGDTDTVCNYLLGQGFCRNLEIPLVKAKKAWAVGSQIGGFVTRFLNLDFVTVKGAGHMVPGDKPKAALQMITSFLNNEPY